MTAPSTRGRLPHGAESPVPGEPVLPGGGGWLRIVLALACALTMATVFVHGQSGGTNFVQWVLMVSITLWVVGRPGSGGAAMLLIGALVVRIFLEKAQLDVRLIALVVLLPLVHQLSALAAVVPVRSTVRWAALTPTLLRYLGAVLATVIGLLVSLWLGWW